MKMFTNLKVISATILCFIIAITLCACKKAPTSSSEANGTSQNSSLTSLQTSSIDEQIESSSDSAVTSTSSDDTKNESSSKSSKLSSNTSSKTPTSSKPTSTPSTTTPPSTTSSNTTPTTPSKTPAQIIVGKWRGSVDMAPMLSEEGISVESPQMVSCDVEFTSNGVIYETIDRVSMKTVYTNIFIQVLNNQLVENNLTKEQFEAAIGKNYDEYLNELVQEAMEYTPQTIISAYKFVGKDLYVREQEDTDFEKEEYSFSGENKLTIVESGVSVTYTRIN